ncbi:ABC transporter ATP-binding protein [Pseudomaricurvus alkylphenolicus]|uniref:ABC transporter ATP-binding protein n=1 Tax=Pseudomaricurvus alkylphenolicus TaxID=1306991 RepID=UPI001421B5D4|nr:ABC transporter ATP-binding protein [Pseudomaricurvus alkylphenolicus]NIB39206.1 ABC transporter ATP-binding protein [Pseudomaricurvus alkylphenolicus]
MTSPAIVTKGMSRYFGDHKAVDGVDLNIPSGSIYGFLGPNGCGKSTSIRMLTGLLTPTRGSVKVLGYELPHQAEALRVRIGYMTQKFSLYADLTVRENLYFVGRIYNLSGKVLRARVDELMVLYHLEAIDKQLAGSLSGGQKQRLALAAATIHDPDLLFLDEPTSAVDPENRREFWERLFDLCGEGKTILVSTHYMDEAERCHGLAILENGIKRADGSPQALMQRMGANVIEIDGGNNQLRQLKNQLIARPEIISAAQLGTRLRVLVSSEVPQPLIYLSKQLGRDEQKAQRRLQQVRPSLEDVFVTCTGNRNEFSP